MSVHSLAKLSTVGAWIVTLNLSKQTRGLDEILFSLSVSSSLMQSFRSVGPTVMIRIVLVELREADVL